MNYIELVIEYIVQIGGHKLQWQLNLGYYLLWYAGGFQKSEWFYSSTVFILYVY